MVSFELFFFQGEVIVRPSSNDFKKQELCAQVWHKVKSIYTDSHLYTYSH